MLMKAGKLVGAGAAVAVVCGLAATYGFSQATPFATVQNFLIAWQVENFKAAAMHTTGVPKDQVIAQLRAVRPELDAASLRPSLQGARIVKSGDGYDARFTVNVDLGQNGNPWVYQSQMHLKLVHGTYQIVWSPSVIHPDLGPGERFAVLTTPQPRQPINDVQGKSLLQPSRKAQLVGVYPGQLSQDQAQDTMNALSKVLTGLDPTRLMERVTSAPPDQFLQLALIDPATTPHRTIDRLHAIPALQFEPFGQPVEASMAPQLVGSLGTATSQELQELGAPYQPGDIVGVSGLQFLFQRQLASTPTVQIVVQNSSGQTTQPLATWVPRDTPQPIQTSLDATYQARAQKALASLKVPASLVAVQPTSGEVVAVANQNTSSDLALTGQYLPGMTFGIVSGEALLSKGMQPTDPVDCPATTADSVGSSSSSGSTFQVAFGKPCGSAMMQSLAGRVDTPSLLQQAAAFGIGKNLGLAPVSSFTGQITTPRTEQEKATMMAGQGGVLVSPLNMAVAAASVSSGTFRPPKLFRQAPPIPSGTAQGQGPVAEPQVLDGSTISALQQIMHHSVTSGSARSANYRNQLLGGLVSQVTDSQGKTVSWFVGYVPSTVAFAIAIEGKVNAATVASAFLAAR
jgi:cell division protein FtsI/penicillin-binding protein 2